jgi:hypothetical protein
MVLIQPTFAQKRPSESLNDTLATIGSGTITGRDLLERIELMPWLDRGQGGKEDSAKIKATASLVAEKLLALEGASMGIGTDNESKQKRRSLEHMFVRDELYNREVKQQVKVKPEELLLGLRMYSRDVRALVLSAPSKEALEPIYRKLAKSRRPDSLMVVFSRSNGFFCDTATVAYGGTDLELEATAYSAPIAKVSEPFICETYGWGVLYVLKKPINNEYAGKNDYDRSHRVETIITERKESAQAKKYFNSVLVPKSATGNQDLFERFVDTLYACSDTTPSFLKANKGCSITPPALETAAKKLKMYDDSILVQMEGEQFTFREGLEAFRNTLFVFKPMSREQFEKALNSLLKVLVQNEYLAREGIRKNLHLSKKVRHDIDMWTDNWTAQILKARYVDSIKVTEEEAFREMISKADAIGKPYLVNVQEVLSDSLSVISTVVERLRSGDDLGDLAVQYSKRKEWALNRGISGWIPVPAYPEIGIYALAADSGALVGPIKLKEGYSLFRVLGVKRIDSTTAVDFKHVVQQLVEGRTQQQRMCSLNRYIAGLAGKYRASIRFDAVKQIGITKNPMYTKRYIGFGGTITAAPLLTPQWEWISHWQQLLLP